MGDTTAAEPVAVSSAAIQARRLVGPDDSRQLGVTHMTIDGEHDPVAIDESDIVFYVLEGQGWFELDGERDELRAGSYVVVPSGTPFSYGGRMTFLNIQAPPFDQKHVRRLGRG